MSLHADGSDTFMHHAFSSPRTPAHHLPLHAVPCASWGHIVWSCEAGWCCSAPVRWCGSLRSWLGGDCQAACTVLAVLPPEAASCVTTSRWPCMNLVMKPASALGSLRAAFLNYTLFASKSRVITFFCMDSRVPCLQVSLSCASTSDAPLLPSSCSCHAQQSLLDMHALSLGAHDQAIDTVSFPIQATNSWMHALLADGQVWVEHGYLSDAADLQHHPNGRCFLEQNTVVEDELVNSQSLYHSPAQVIEGGLHNLPFVNGSATVNPG